MNAHSKVGASPRFSRLGLTAVTTAGILAAGTSAAQAEIITTVSGLTTTAAPDTSASDGNDIFFSFATGQAQKNAFDGYQYRLNNASGTATLSTPGTLNSAPNSYLAQCNGNTLFVNRLLAGDSISADTGTATYFPFNGSLAGEGADYKWHAGDAGYLGFRMTATNGDYNYGWADITVGSDYNVTLNQFAYENTSNQAIVAGAGAIVPEANPLELLLIGAAGLGTYRLLLKKRTTEQ